MVIQKEPNYRQWLVPKPRAVFLLVHGLGAHAGRWEAMADFFLKKDISSYAVELRSPNPANKTDEREDRIGSYYSKIFRLYDMAVKENGAKKIFLVGESLGAIISFLVCADRPGLFNGLICISPAFAVRRKTAFLDYVRMLAPLFYNPAKELSVPFDSSMCTRDINYRNKLDKDPREYRSVSSRFVFEIMLAQVRAAVVRKKMLTPALFLVAEEDRIVDPAAARAAFNDLAVKDKTLVGFPGMYHSLSIELGKEEVFEEMLKWVEERIA